MEAGFSSLSVGFEECQEIGTRCTRRWTDRRHKCVTSEGFGPILEGSRAVPLAARLLDRILELVCDIHFSRVSWSCWCSPCRIPLPRRLGTVTGVTPSARPFHGTGLQHPHQHPHRL